MILVFNLIEIDQFSLIYNNLNPIKKIYKNIRQKESTNSKRKNTESKPGNQVQKYSLFKQTGNVNRTGMDKKQNV